MTVAELKHELSFYEDEWEIDLVVELDWQIEDELGRVMFSVNEKRVKLVNIHFDRALEEWSKS